MKGRNAQSPQPRSAAQFPLQAWSLGAKDDSTHQNAKRMTDEAHGAPETYHARVHGAPLLDLNSGRSSRRMRTELRARSLMWTKVEQTYPRSAK
jgi:hypothetical protein